MSRLALLYTAILLVDLECGERTRHIVDARVVPCVVVGPAIAAHLGSPLSSWGAPWGGTTNGTARIVARLLLVLKSEVGLFVCSTRRLVIIFFICVCWAGTLRARVRNWRSLRANLKSAGTLETRSKSPNPWGGCGIVETLMSAYSSCTG